MGPGAAGAEEGIGEDQELAHDRDERELGRLADGAEGIVLALMAALKRTATRAGR
jgi:hypothetical protein